TIFERKSIEYGFIVVLDTLLLNVPHKPRKCCIAWLNPMATERWFGTTAGEIARLMPMFEVSRQGFDGAIDVLRGRGINAQLR
ncbi:MAG: hypothetical protein V7K92_22360, partial [Nostoc sp.]